ncbi:MAG: AbgT family transporter [Candidatus Kapaibacteriales bacterium]
MSEKKKGLIDRFLVTVETIGNKLPHPATLFALFAIITVVLSFFFSLWGIEAAKPITGEIIRPVNLMSEEGLHKILSNMVTNFTGFAPLGTVLVAMLGIGIAESSGLIASVIKTVVFNAYVILIALLAIIGIAAVIIIGGEILPIVLTILFTIGAIALVIYLNKKQPQIILTFIIVFAGVLSNTASEVGYVLLVPLGAIMFLGAGRHPIAGLAAAFAGVSGGYSANLLLGTIDPLLAGLSQEAAQIVDPNYTVNAAANLYFMMGSTFFIAIAGTFVTEKIVLPRLGKYIPKAGDAVTASEDDANKTLSRNEKKGLAWAGFAGLLFGLFLLLAALPEGLLGDSLAGLTGFMRNDETGDLLRSPFMSSIVAFIFLGAAVTGIAYGYGSGNYKSDSDIMNGMGKAMETLGIYIVLVFFAAQFVKYFEWTNLGLITAIKGASFLGALELPSFVLILAFVLLSAIINLVMGSASAKWAIMAPVFIPMFMLLGYSPELVQCAYRVGDSVTNIISPMMSYFALIVAFLSRYTDKEAGIGSVVATMLPYSVVFLIVWSIILIVWLQLGIPIGPDSPLDYIVQPTAGL